MDPPSTTAARPAASSSSSSGPAPDRPPATTNPSSSSSSSATAPATQPAVLKRGSACQYCRRRKLKCSGDRPICEGCTKYGRECVYDGPKPKSKSKIERLEDQIAHLESLLSDQKPPPPASEASSSRRPTHTLSANTSSSAEGSRSFSSTAAPPAGPPPTSATTTSSAAYHPYSRPAKNNVSDQQSFTSALGELFAAEQFQPTFNEHAPERSHVHSGGQTADGSGGYQGGIAPPFFAWSDVSLVQGQSISSDAGQGDLGSYSTFGGFDDLPSASLPGPGFEGEGGLDFGNVDVLQSLGMASTGAGFGLSGPDGQPPGVPFSTSHPTTNAAIFDQGPAGFLPVSQTTSYTLPAGFPDLPSISGDAASSGFPADPSYPSPSANVPHFIHQPSSFSPPTLSPYPPSSAFPQVSTDPTTGAVLVPRSMRDSLLALFWKRKRQFACNMHPRFFARLDKPAEEGGIHSSLTFAMMTCAAKFSPVESVRQLEKVFFEETKRLVNEALLAKEARAVNVIQANTILAVYLYSSGRYTEGWTRSAVAIKLCVVCQLHRLPSSLSSTNSAPPVPCVPPGPSRRKVSSFLAPCRDAIDFGDRCWAFWLAIVSDKTAAVADSWPGTLADSEITTPFPRPLEEYCAGDFESYDGTQDSDMLDLFSDSVLTAVPKRQDALGGSIVKSLVLLHRACRLFDRPDEPTISLDDIRPLSARSSISVSPDHEGRPGPPQTPSGGPSPQSSTTTSASLCFAPYDWSTVDVPPSYTFPPEVIEFERTMDCFVAHIPQAYRDPARKVAGGVVPWDQEVSGPHDLGNWDLERPAQGGEISGINPVVILLHTQLYTCFVFLHEEQSRYDRSYWTKAVAAAKSMVSLIQLIANVDFGKLDIFLVVCWKIAAHALLAEAKLQRKAGNDGNAESALIEVQVLVLAMQRLGSVFAIGSSHALSVEGLKSLSLDDDLSTVERGQPF